MIRTQTMREKSNVGILSRKRLYGNLELSGSKKITGIAVPIPVPIIKTEK